MKDWTAFAAFAALALAACSGPENPFKPLPEPSYEEFVVSVQPIVEKRCAYLGCHGTLERQLKLYAMGLLRAAPEFPDAPFAERGLTQGELSWNYDSLRARMVGEVSADDSRLLRKCLDPAKGGTAHATPAVVVFKDVSEPEYISLRDWIETGL